MPFRGTHAVPTVFVTVLVAVGFAAAAQADWEFSTLDEPDMDPASRRTYERERGASTLFLSPDGNFKLPEAISNSS